jgi:hypothetical protein
MMPTPPELVLLILIRRIDRLDEPELGSVTGDSLVIDLENAA